MEQTSIQAVIPCDVRTRVSSKSGRLVITPVSGLNPFVVAAWQLAIQQQTRTGAGKLRYIHRLEAAKLNYFSSDSLYLISAHDAEELSELNSSTRSVTKPSGRFLVRIS